MASDVLPPPDAGLVVIGAGITGRTLPFISNERQALLALLVIVVAKVALTALHSRFI